MAHIYKIINDINDKVYIGKTNLTIKERFKDHCESVFRERCEKRPLYAVMKKYGIEHFSIEEIEECPSDEASEREIQWIALYNSYHNGYNATLGGDGKNYYNHEQIANDLRENPYPKEIGEKYGCSVYTVRIIAKEYNIPLKLKGQENFLKKSKTIYQYDKQTKEFIQSFKSTADAARWCFENQKASSLKSGVRSHISECANKKRKSAYGYIWSYEKI